MIKNLPKNRFAAIVALFISLLMPTVAKAQEAYAVEDGTTLTFYYDGQRTNRTGTVYGIDQKREDNNIFPVWAGSYSVKNDRITKAVFDASFKNYLHTSTAYWFLNCSKLETIEGLDNLNTTNVTDMSWMFYNCKALTRLDVSSLNTQNVTKMNYMFSGCSALTTLDLSNFNTAKVTNMSFMLGYCYALTTLDISNFKTEKVTDMSAMFYGCSALTTIYCNYTWTCSSSSEMFNGCTSLKGAVPFDSSKNGVSMANPYTGYFTATGEFEAYAVEDGTTLTFYYDVQRDTRTGTVYSVTDDGRIPEWANSGQVTKVVFRAFFNYYHPSSTSRWFYNCTALETIEGIENLNTENVIDMSLMFNGCKALTSLDLSNFNTAKVTDMNSMFNGCSALTKLDVSNFNTEKVTDMSYMFSGCSALTTINCSRAWTCNESTDMFKGCTSLIGAVAYDASKTDVTMANPFTGYFNCDTEAYAVEDGTTLTFYYDKLRAIRTGTVYNIGSTQGNTNITKAVFDASFKDYRPSTTEKWFYNCTALATIEGIENLNTENVTIMDGMFNGCSKLTTIDVSGFNTENVTDMHNMFNGCSALEWLDLSSFNTAKVTDMHEMFLNCGALKTIYCNDAWTCDNSTNMFAGCTSLKGAVAYDASKLDVSMANPETGYFTTRGETEAYAVKDGTTLTFYYDDQRANRTGTVYGINQKREDDNYYPAWAGNDYEYNDRITKAVFDASFKNYLPTSTAYWFYNCTALATIEGIENLNTANVTDMSCLFRECKSLTSLNLSNFNTSKVIKMNQMFWGCSSLTSLNLSNFNTSKVIKMNQMFWGCSSLTSLDVSGFNTENTTDMREMFRGCSSLTSLDVSGFNTENTTDMGMMFHGCSSLSSLDVTKFSTANVTDMGYMFNGCTALASLDVSNFNTSNVTDMCLMFENCSSLTSLDVSNFNTANVTNMHRMFSGCQSLTTIDLSNYITDKVTNMYSMFDGCSSLSSLDVSNFNTANVTSMNGMFKGCSLLTSLDVSNFNTSNVKNMSNMFSGCSSLSSLDVTGFSTANVTYMGYMFRDCSSLTSLDLSNFNTANVTNMSGMFYSCKSLTSLDVSSFNTENVTNMYSMFDGCSSLSSLDVTGFNTVNVTNMRSMFNGCLSLTSLDVSNFNTEKATTMSSMFRDCSALTSLDVSSFNTTNVIYIREMFNGCSALTTIYCNRSWTCSDSESMFLNCTSLKGYVAYNANYTTAIAANPNWYFTKSDSRAYAVVNEGVITFYYDKQTDNRTGTVFSVPEAGHAEAWVGSTNETITKAVFDVSFYGYVPGSTAYWFCNFNALQTIEGFGNLNTESVTDMTRMFYNCNSLESLDLSTFNTTNVTDMTGMFYNCNSLTSLNVSNFKTNNVTFMSGMFEGCSALTSLNLSSFNTMKVADISSMFSGCESLTSLDVSKFSVDKVVNMKHMFSDCAQLTTIVCDDAWSCPDSKKMFDDCTKLKGAAEYDESMTDAAMANPETGYFTRVGASSVSEVNADTESGATGTYNMLGVKMHDDLQSLSAGIYIVNGKKVIVK